MEEKVEENNDPICDHKKCLWVSPWSLTAFYYKAVDWQVMIMNAYFLWAARMEVKIVSCLQATNVH